MAKNRKGRKVSVLREDEIQRLIRSEYYEGCKIRENEIYFSSCQTCGIARSVYKLN